MIDQRTINLDKVFGTRSLAEAISYAGKNGTVYLAYFPNAKSYERHNRARSKDSALPSLVTDRRGKIIAEIPVRVILGLAEDTNGDIERTALNLRLALGSRVSEKIGAMQHGRVSSRGNKLIVKLADLATFDDAGDLIPLSRRFDRGSDDIRFSSARSAAAADLSSLPEATRRAVGAIRHVLPNVRFHAVRDEAELRRAASSDSDSLRASRVTDENIEKEFNTPGKYITTYRSAMLAEDGSLLPPMATKGNGSMRLGEVYRAEEHPERIDKKGNYPLKSGMRDSGASGTVYAKYNPYFHSQLGVINDQFSIANDKSRMVTVECRVLKSDIESGYRAEGAKDPVGPTEWTTKGPVAMQIMGDGQRRSVILSRYIMPVRVLSREEEAQRYKAQIGDNPVSIPGNVVTPGLRAELERLGLDISRNGPSAFSWKKLTDKRRAMSMPRFTTGAFNAGATRADMVEAGKRSVRQAGGMDTKRGLVLNIPAFGDVVVVGKPGLKHGLRPYTAEYGRLDNVDNADILPVIGEVLKNSIPVNEARPRNGEKTDGATILFGAAVSENGSIVPVVSVVNHIRDTNETPPVAVYPLKSVNAKGRLEHAFDTQNIEDALSQVSIADLISEVKDEIPIFSKDVYQHFGQNRRPAEEVSGLRFLRSTQGRTVGAFDKATNSVFLTPEATAGTVRHEVLGHALWQRAKQASGDAYGKFREIAAAAPKEIADFVRENYPDLEIGSEAWEDELFAHVVEKEATGIAAEVEKFGKLHPVRAWWNRVVQAIGNVWRALTGQDAFKKYRMLKPAAALDSIIRDAMNGRSFGPLEAEEGGGTRQAIENNMGRATFEDQRPSAMADLNAAGDSASIPANERDAQDVQIQRDRLPGQGDGDEVGRRLPPGGRGDALVSRALEIGRNVLGGSVPRIQGRYTGEQLAAFADAAKGIAESAREHGVWHDDIESELDARYGTGEDNKDNGSETKVWFDEGRGLAVKAIGLDYYTDPTLALQRIALHNKYFPDHSLNVVGFGNADFGMLDEATLTRFKIIAEQPIADKSKLLSAREIRERLEERGFRTLEGDEKVAPGLNMETPDGQAVVVDLNNKNVFGTENGGVAVIDCDIRPKSFYRPEAANQPGGGGESGGIMFSSAASAAAVASAAGLDRSGGWRMTLADTEARMKALGIDWNYRRGGMTTGAATRAEADRILRTDPARASDVVRRIVEHHDPQNRRGATLSAVERDIGESVLGDANFLQVGGLLDIIDEAVADLDAVGGKSLSATIFTRTSSEPKLLAVRRFSGISRRP